jgi:hypothetical protein
MPREITVEFIDREYELGVLNRAYGEETSQFIVL